MKADRERARRVLQRLEPPKAKRDQKVDAQVFAWIQMLCELAGPLTLELEDRVRPWRTLEAQRREEMLRELRTSPAGAPVEARKRKSK